MTYQAIVICANGQNSAVAASSLNEQIRTAASRGWEVQGGVTHVISNNGMHTMSVLVTGSV